MVGQQAVAAGIYADSTTPSSARGNSSCRSNAENQVKPATRLHALRLITTIRARETRSARKPASGEQRA
jgi:hypothetical protein